MLTSERQPRSYRGWGVTVPRKLPKNVFLRKFVPPQLDSQTVTCLYIFTKCRATTHLAVDEKKILCRNFFLICILPKPQNSEHRQVQELITR